MKQVYLARDPIDAEVVKKKLLAAGIPAVIRAESFAVAPAPFPSVWVEDTIAENARAVLAEGPI